VGSDVEFDLAVRGGLVVTEDSAAVCDIGVKDGTIAAMAIDLPQKARREIRAEGLIVVPGAIDVHTHFANIIGGRPTADDYESGSRAAACGGITAFVNVAFQEQGESLQETADKELSRSANSHIDFGVHLTITDPERRHVLDEIGPLADAGFASLKTFTAVPGLRLTDDQMLRVLDAPAARVDAVLETVGLGDVERRVVRTLSGGQLSRVSLATALLGEPELLVLDEPTVGLDPVLRHELWELFRSFADAGTTLLVSSHVMDEADRCERLLLMRDGSIVAGDTPDGLRERTGADDIEHAFLILVDQGASS